MSDQAQPSAGEEQEVSSSGLLLSVEPLAGAANYKLSGDDSGSDSTDVSGGGSDSSDASDTDSSDDSGGDDGGGSDVDSSDDSESDADGTDAADADGTDTGADADGTDPLGIASDGKSSGSGIADR